MGGSLRITNQGHTQHKGRRKGRRRPRHKCHRRHRTRAPARAMDPAVFRTPLGSCLLMPIRMTQRASILFRVAITGTILSTQRHSRSAREWPWPPCMRRSRPSRPRAPIIAARRLARHLTWLTRVISPQCLHRTAVRMAWLGKARTTQYRRIMDHLRAHPHTCLCSRHSICLSNRLCL